MSHSLIKIWIHGVFSTKDRLPIIKSGFEKELYRYIETELKENLGCQVSAINGTENHIHLLFALDSGHSVSEIFKQIKGSSSHWVNSNKKINTKFAWQTGYAAFSISESMIIDVINYIKNQKEHHRKKTFEEEYQLFLDKYGLKT